WRLLQRFDHAKPEVRVYNPDYERHGWQSTHTAVEVLHHDLPFLVDSVRTELNRRGYSIHTLQTTVLSVRRGSQGELLEVLAKGAQGEDVLHESLMYLEIDRCANAAELSVLARELEQVLGEVRMAVQDFEPMKAKVREMITLVEQTAFASDAQEKAEITAFLEWLTDNHFTFLGYEEFVVDADAQGGQLHYDPQSFLGLTRLLRAGLTSEDLHIEDYAVQYLHEPMLLSFAKAAHPSRVHRPAYPDYVSIRQIDGDGKVLKECRFMGLYTSSVYGESVREIPYIRRKVAEIERRSGFHAKAHLGKELAQVVEVLPRDDLFQTPIDELFSTVMSIVQIQERNKIRVFLRKDPYGRFCYCLAYVPRDVYSTEVRQKIQQVLMERLKASDCEFWTFFSESVLARVQLILRVDPKSRLDIDPQQLENEVIQACRSWQDDYASLTIESFGEAAGTNVLADFPKGFPAGFR
ncbi:MAG: NAD-glutamate dehydrogenase, partial [Proteobacteria bacterium]